MYELFSTNKFKRDFRKCQRRNKNMDALKSVIDVLVTGEPLPTKYKDHLLIGNYSDHRKCHIEPDWLLIYRINDDEKLIELVRTGTHSDLF